MPKVSTMTASPVELKLGGDTYKLSPLTHSDLGEFERWCQDRLIEVAKRAGEGMAAADRQALLADAVSRASAISLTSPEASRLMSSMDGIVRLMHLSLRHHHPDIELEQVHEMLSDPRALDEAMASFDAINDLAGGKGEDGSGK